MTAFVAQLSAVLLALAAAPAPLGHSEGGRPIVVVRAGEPSATRVLVFGCIHGNEGAGIAVARALEHVHAGADLWIVPNVNPDGYARGTRQNARGVDLNRNWPAQWHGGGRAGDLFYAGPRPFSERETRIARNLIERIRPRLTIWFHQHMNLVWAWGPSADEGRTYAHAAGMRFYRHRWLAGTASSWESAHFPGTASLTVELPAGRLSPQQVGGHVQAVLTVARGTRRLEERARLREDRQRHERRRHAEGRAHHDDRASSGRGLRVPLERGERPAMAVGRPRHRAGLR
jgi:murein peptide amidase A